MTSRNACWNDAPRAFCVADWMLAVRGSWPTAATTASPKATLAVPRVTATSRPGS